MSHRLTPGYAVRRNCAWVATGLAAVLASLIVSGCGEQLTTPPLVVREMAVQGLFGFQTPSRQVTIEWARVSESIAANWGAIGNTAATLTPGAYIIADVRGPLICRLNCFPKAIGRTYGGLAMLLKLPGNSLRGVQATSVSQRYQKLPTGVQFNLSRVSAPPLRVNGKVPKLIDLSPAEAAALLGRDGQDTRLEGRQVASALAMSIVGQSPLPGTLLHKGQYFTLYVVLPSKG